MWNHLGSNYIKEVNLEMKKADGFQRDLHSKTDRLVSDGSIWERSFSMLTLGFFESPKCERRLLGKSCLNSWLIKLAVWKSHLAIKSEKWMIDLDKPHFRLGIKHIELLILLWHQKIHTISIGCLCLRPGK